MTPQRDAHTLLAPDAMPGLGYANAQNYWQYNQDTTAWTLELDLRPAVEKF